MKCRHFVPALMTSLILLAGLARADETKKSRLPKGPSDKDVKFAPDAWTKGKPAKLTPVELDALLLAAQKGDKLKLSAVVADDVFMRRVALDLLGRLPSAEMQKFLADKSSDRRGKFIDDLLKNSAYSKHRARQWRDIMLSRATEIQGFVKRPREITLQNWLAEQFKENKSWKTIAHELITADGGLNLREPKTNSSGFLLSHTRTDGPVERTNDVVRVFLGINLQCAQCHDHPDDIWKRNQFHQMAAFFGRLGERIKFTREPFNFETNLSSRPFGEYRMPDLEDASKKTPMQPKFLDGSSPGSRLSDKARRKALSKYITDEKNYYFAAAFVNRVWGELMGQAFVQPVENLGPLQQPVYGEVLAKLALHFRATEYDIKDLYKLIMNTQAYQRQVRMGDQATDHVRFSGTYPTRLSAETLWDSLTVALGSLSSQRGGMRRGPMGGGGFRGRFTPPLRNTFLELFRFDPSTKPEDVEGSVPQSLLLMNNPTINAQIKATGETVLAKILKANDDDAAALEKVYLRALGRKPTANEVKKCLAHIKKVGKRGAAFEDILWALINSAEFRTKR